MLLYLFNYHCVVRRLSGSRTCWGASGTAAAAKPRRAPHQPQAKWQAQLFMLQGNQHVCVRVWLLLQGNQNEPFGAFLFYDTGKLEAEGGDSPSAFTPGR